MSVGILSTGWFSQNKKSEYVTHGDDSIRGTDFRHLWWESIDAFIRPEMVFVVDSASPIKVDDTSITNTKIKTLELNINPGHSQNCKYDFCGWMWSVLLGMDFTYASDADYFIYLEQDALVFGNDIIKSIEKQLLTQKFVFGKSDGTVWPIQQSFFAIRKDAIREFLANIYTIAASDKIVPPEIKFCAAANGSVISKILSVSSGFFDVNFIRRVVFRLMRLNFSYATLDFGYGRTRPINFSDENFYFQHGSSSELEMYKNLIGYKK